MNLLFTFKIIEVAQKPPAGEALLYNGGI